ncbi:ankyrin repeat-containing domain protein, partial [Metarhizium hybridum]
MAAWLPKLVRSGLKPLSVQQKSSTREGVRLEQLTPERDRSNTDIDIVAIHGLDTKSPDTWTWKSKEGKPDVNWLADSCMLPRQVDRARIFTCDWPASLFNPSEQAPKTVDEYTAPLLEGIRRELLEDDDLQGEPRPILFIASCLGGIILSAALVDAARPNDHYRRIFQATRGIVFLATPFRGTSFADVADWAEVGLRFLASIRDQKIATLIDNVKGPRPLSKLNQEFTRICQHREPPLELVSFYEGKKTSLPRKAFPWLPLPGWLCQERLLVDENSANLDMISYPLRLERRHSEMNKFSDDCEDYRVVAGKIKAVVAAVLRGTPLNHADDFIRTKRYTKARLDIVRLSGAPLSMEQCYINLALVDQGKQDGSDGIDPGNRYALDARLKVQTPDKAMQVSLSTLFNDRDGKMPRRILIRGSAGVGKTTLCKKIVYDFYHGTELHCSWASLFDRVLWIPLRKLKEKPLYSWNELLRHEFFSAPVKRKDLADHLAALLPKIRHRTLFLLDGLDEILPDLDREGNRFVLLEELLGQQNVIITSRPSATLPSHLGRPDLELETIGFYPPQVKEYIEKTFANSENNKDGVEKARSMISFLDQHWLLRSLVRIPIQLDALCYTWDESGKQNLGKAPKTMTAIYIALEDKLWKKDAVKMGKRDGGTPVTASHVASGATTLMSNEKQFLELLAFSGLHNDKIEFFPADWNKTCSHLKLQDFLPGKQLPQMSFLRGADQEPESGPYHFIHLTFQEYFAARYFVAKWKDPGGQLALLGQDSAERDPASPEQYLRRHKYTARYDMFWRFVAGILDQEYSAQVANFINAIEQEPLDLLGPTHQRLVMHCLSEISSPLQLRRGLECRLKQWLLFEVKAKRGYESELASQAEFPDLVLNSAIKTAVKNPWHLACILRSLAKRAFIPDSTLEIISPWLCSGHSNLKCALEALCGPSPLPDAVLEAVVGQLNHSKSYQASEVLRGRPDLPEKLIFLMAKGLDDQNSYLKYTLRALGQRSSLPDQVMLRVAGCIKHEGREVRAQSIDTLRSLDTLPLAVLKLMEAGLDDADSRIGKAAFTALCAQSCLPDEVAQAIATRFCPKDPAFFPFEEVFSEKPLVLPASLLSALLERLDVGQWIMRTGTARLLGTQPALPSRVLSSIALRLNDHNRYVRVHAIEVLGKRPSLPEELLLGVTARLHDEDDYVRSVAVETLSWRPDLSDEMRRELMAALDDEAFCVRNAFVHTSSHQRALSNEVLSAVVRQLGHDAYATRFGVMSTLSRQTKLSHEFLAVVASHVKDENFMVRRAAMEALSNMSVLPTDSSFFSTIVGGLNDPDESVRQLAVEALSKCPKIPDDLVADLPTKLGIRRGMSRSALTALCRQSVLPETVLSAVSTLLYELHPDDSEVLVKILQDYPDGCFFPCILSSSHAAAIFKPLLAESFKQPLSFYIEDGEFCFNIPEGVRRFPVGNGNPDILEHLKCCRPPDLPAVSGVPTGEDEQE